MPDGSESDAAPPARRVTERGRRTRERILEAATELFGTRGYAGTRVDDILRRSGTGKGQFYHHFDDKADVGRAVLRRQRRSTLPGPQSGRGLLDGWAKIGAWFDDILRTTERRLHAGGVQRPFHVDGAPDTDPLRREYLKTMRLRRRLLRRGLSRMRRSGALVQEADPERLAAFAAATIEGGLRFAGDDGSVDPLRHALGEAYDHLRGYASDEQEPHARPARAG